MIVFHLACKGIYGVMVPVFEFMNIQLFIISKWRYARTTLSYARTTLRYARTMLGYANIL